MLELEVPFALAMNQSAHISLSHAPAFRATNPTHIWIGNTSEIPAFRASGDCILFPVKSTLPKTLVCQSSVNLWNASNNRPSAKQRRWSPVLVRAVEKPQQKVVDRPIARSLIPVENEKFGSQLDPVQEILLLSPKESLGGENSWRQFQGSENWAGLLGDQLHPTLRREIVRYGEFVQATYDAFDFEPHSKYCGSCRYRRQKMLEKVGLDKTGYNITKYLYAMSDIHLPKWFGRPYSVDDNTWSNDSNWIGYVAVSTDEEVIKRLGRRDIVVAWRGTVTQLEWMEDFQDILHPLGEPHDNSSVKVERGFLSMYTSKDQNTRYNKLSASEQAMKELGRLVDVYTQKGEDVSITITGHSLGGALALLSAYEVAAKGVNSHKADPERTVPVTVFSFGAPRVGNWAFKERLEALGVKVLRVVSQQDMVPKMPGIIFNEGMEKFEQLMKPLVDNFPWTYTHVGVELELDRRRSPFLKENFDPADCHNLEGYLHLLDGFQSSSAPFRGDAKRDVALVNKASNILRPELMVPGNWYQLENKGLVRNSDGIWVQAERDPEDVPSPNHVLQETLTLGLAVPIEKGADQCVKVPSS